LQAGDDTKIVVGNYYSTDNFEKPIKINDRIELNDKQFRVIGIYESVGNKQDDLNLFITDDAYQEMYDPGEDVTQVIAKMAPGTNPDKVAERIAKSLRSSRDVEKGQEDFEISTAEDLLNSFGSILDIVQIFLVAIAAISLLVGAVGITNTMYTAVLERTKEIGVMKAIGARNNTIRLIFLIESGMLGIVGGAIGILIGAGISKLVVIAIHASGFTVMKASFGWELILGALCFSWLVGTISGVTPAVQASNQKPVDALRYE